MSDVLHDDDERNRIRTVFDKSMFVEAGAGTGKTSELVKRIVGIVEGGHARINEIVAITFTEAAAGELRERVRTQLESRIEERSGEVAGRLATAVVDIETAPIQTIHAFANRLLQIAPTSLGLPPVFSVRNQIESTLEFDRSWRATIRKTFGATTGSDVERERLLNIAWALSIDFRKLRALARGMWEHAHRLQVCTPQTLSANWTVEIGSLVATADALIGFADVCRTAEDKMVLKLVGDVTQWRDSLATAQRSDDEIAIVTALGNPAPTGKKVGVAKNWPTGVLDNVRDGLEALEVERCRVLAPVKQWALDYVIAIVSAAAIEAQDRRVSEGTLEFQDLLVLAEKFTSNPRWVNLLHEQFRYVFVDEFQDTDPLQTRIVQNLVRREGQENEQLFTVGDPKQSIYRFRNADLGQYQLVRQSNESNVAKLVTNFRTLSNILNWIDSIFVDLMRPTLGADWASLVPGRLGAHSGAVHVFGNAADKGILSATVREKETEELAQRLLVAKRDEWVVHEEDGAQRPIRFGDMAVLLPTRRSLAQLERSFRKAQIPYRIDSRSLIWSTQEIRDVVAVLGVLADDADEHVLIAALRSPAFGCGDDELLDHIASGAKWSLDAVVVESRVGIAIEQLKQLRQRASFMDVPDIVEMVITELKLHHTAFAYARQREIWNRLHFVSEQALRWHDEGGAGLYEFLQWVRESTEMQSSMFETIVPESDDDVVQIMTIHAAKGLEFPLAAVVGLGAIPNQAESVRVFWSNHATKPCVRVGPKADLWQTLDFEDALTREEDEELAERIRLLYVAVTRARDYLLVGVHRKGAESGRPSLATMVANVATEIETEPPAPVILAKPPVILAKPPVIPANAPVIPANAPVIPANAGIHVELSAEEESEKIEAQNKRRVQALRKGKQSNVISATRVAQKVSQVDDVLPSATAGALVDESDLTYRLSFGSCVHAVMQLIDLDAGNDECQRMSKVVADEFGLQGYEHLVAESVEKLLSSALVNEAFASGRYWREVPVARQIDTTVVRGTIDLLFERDGGLVIVDYKTEAIHDDEQLAHASARYRYQLLTYAAALQQDGNVVDELVLLFAPPGEGEAVASVFTADDPESSIREVLGTLISQS